MGGGDPAINRKKKTKTGSTLNRISLGTKHRNRDSERSMRIVLVLVFQRFHSQPLNGIFRFVLKLISWLFKIVVDNRLYFHKKQNNRLDIDFTSDVKNRRKDGCMLSPRSFFSSPPSHSGHKCALRSNTHDLSKSRTSNATRQNAPVLLTRTGPFTNRVQISLQHPRTGYK